MSIYIIVFFVVFVLFLVAAYLIRIRRYNKICRCQVCNSLLFPVLHEGRKDIYQCPDCGRSYRYFSDEKIFVECCGIPIEKGGRYESKSNH